MDSTQIAAFGVISVPILVALITGILALLRKPSDVNEAARIAREWYRGMLEDAKGEREELRKTIESLEAKDADNSADIDRLQTLLRRKDTRIRELEDRQAANVEKLRAGQVLTLADILGPDADLLNDIEDLERTEIRTRS